MAAIDRLNAALSKNSAALDRGTAAVDRAIAELNKPNPTEEAVDAAAASLEAQADRADGNSARLEAAVVTGGQS